MAVFPEAYQAYAAQHVSYSLVSQAKGQAPVAAAAMAPTPAPASAPVAARPAPVAERVTAQTHTDLIVAVPNQTVGLVLGFLALAIGAWLFTHDMRMTRARGR